MRPVIVNNSRYVAKLHKVKSLEEGYDLLLKLYGSEPLKPFIFCSDDVTESFLDEHYDKLKDKFYFYNAGELGRITWLQNKDNITNLGAGAGFEVPKKEIVDTGILPKTLNYPIITKVLASTMGAWKRDVYVCNNEEELKEAYRKIKSPKLCLEEYIIKKGEFSIEGFAINDGKDVFIPYIFDYIRFYENSYGHYMDVYPLEEGEFKQKMLKLFRLTKYNGIFEIEFMKGPHGEKYFLEINFRASTWNYAVTFGGGNLPYYWAVSTLLGRIPTEDIHLRTEKFHAMVEPDDFAENVLKLKRISFRRWWKEAQKSEVHYYYNKKDKSPFYHYCWHRLSRFVLKKLHLVH